LGIVTQQEDRRFRKGPCEIGIADLFAGSAVAFPGRSHDEIIPIGSNGLEKRLWTRWHVAMQQDRTVLGKHTNVPGTGVQINTTIKLVLFRVESHEVSSS